MTDTTTTSPAADLLTPEQCRKLLGAGGRPISDRKLKRLIDEAGLPVLTLGHDRCGKGRRRLFLRSAVLAWLEAGAERARRAKAAGDGARARAARAKVKAPAREHQGGGAVRTDKGWEI